jgi:hypothetical protein
MKSIGNIAKYTFALWLIAVSIAISIGIKQASAFAVRRRLLKEIINLNQMTLFISNSDTMIILLNVEDRTDFTVSQDSTGTDVIYSNQVSFKIENTDEKQPYIQIEKRQRKVIVRS